MDRHTERRDPIDWLRQQRRTLINALTGLMLLLGTIGLAVNVLAAINSRQISFTLIYYIAAYLLALVIFAAGRLSETVRAYGLLVLIYLFAVLAFYSGWLAGGGRLFLLGAIAVSAVLIQPRAGLYLAIVALVTYAAYGVVYSQGWLRIPPTTGYGSLPTILSEGIGFGMSIALVLGSIWFFGRALAAANQASLEAQEARQELAARAQEMEKSGRLIAEQANALEQRNKGLSTVAEVARDISSIQSADKLLETAAELIRQRFNFYHVGIFLLDDTGEYAVLRAATGDAGRLLLASGHRLKVGTIGIVGHAAASGQPRVALDVSADATYYRNPLLPYTRSEIALPLKLGAGRVIGVLDAQSTQQNAFGENEIAILQILADQLSIAIENSRLIQRMEAALREARLAYQQQLQETRQAFARHGETAFEYDRLAIRPARHTLPPSLQEQLRNGRALVLNSRQLKALKMDEHIQSLLLVPLLLREEMIGVIGLERTEDDREWSAEEIEVAQAIATQAALTLENARLLEESQKRVLQERALGEISARISESIRIDNILRITAQELSQLLHGSEVLIQLQGTPEATPARRSA